MSTYIIGSENRQKPRESQHITYLVPCVKCCSWIISIFLKSWEGSAAIPKIKCWRPLWYSSTPHTGFYAHLRGKTRDHERQSSKYHTQTHSTYTLLTYSSTLPEYSKKSVNGKKHFKVSAWVEIMQNSSLWTARDLWSVNSLQMRYCVTYTLFSLNLKCMKILILSRNNE